MRKLHERILELGGDSTWMHLPEMGIRGNTHAMMQDDNSRQIADLVCDWLVKKVVNLRVFDDENGVMNRSILDDGGDIIVVSQFTLMASTKKGNRPSWIHAAPHELSVPLYEKFCSDLSTALGKSVGTGEFGADMKVELLNDGPVTICMDTKNKE